MEKNYALSWQTAPQGAVCALCGVDIEPDFPMIKLSITVKILLFKKDETEYFHIPCAWSFSDEVKAIIKSNQKKA